MSWRLYRRALIEENKWRAARYGIEGKLIDFGKETEVPMRQLVPELLELVDDVVDDLGSRSAVAGSLPTLRVQASTARMFSCSVARRSAHIPWSGPWSSGSARSARVRK